MSWSSALMIGCFIGAALCWAVVALAQRPPRNRRTGLGAPNPACTGTAEQRYMTSLSRSPR
jgi:hypothetical protein